MAHDYLSVQHLTYTYPGTAQPALSQLSLEIQRGEAILLAGPSGSGKSTLARILAGLIPAFYGGTLNGSVQWGGQSMASWPRRTLHQHIGMVFQDPEKQLVCSLVARELVFGLENLGIQPRLIQQRLVDLTAHLPVNHFMTRTTATLSGGEQQLVAIGSIVAMRPHVLILDEPTSQLDPEAAECLLQYLQSLRQIEGLTMILIEHRLERCLPWVDRVVYLEGGAVICDGRAETSSAWLTAHGALGFPLPRESCEAPSPEPRLEIRHLTWGYPNAPRLFDDLAMTVRGGEVVGIVGANGTGKTSLLKLCAGLYDAPHETVWLNGQPISRLNRIDVVRQLGYLAQQPDDYLFHDTVEEEIGYGLRLLGLTNDAMVDQLIQLLGLTRYREAYPRDLSVGERQRVALASILVTAPDVLLLDEPTRGLDPARKLTLAQWLRSFAHNQQRAVVVVTHDLAFADACADRQLNLLSGRLMTPHNESACLASLS